MQNIHADFNQDINAIDLSIEVAEIQIERGNKFSVDIKAAHTDSFKTIDVINESLTVVQKISKWKHPSEWFSRKCPTVKITIPENFEPDKLNASFDVGIFTLENFKAGQLFISTSVGTFEGKNIISETAEIKSSVGKIKIENSRFSKSAVSSETGEIVINGFLHGETKIKTSVGSVKLNINNLYDDYYVTASSSVGQATLNGKKLDEPIGERNAKYWINVSTKVGEIKIKDVK